MARDLAQRCSIDQVKSWIAYVRKDDQVKDIPAFMVSQLELGNVAPQPKAPPPPGEFGEGKSHYRGGKYIGHNPALTQTAPTMPQDVLHVV